MNILPGILLLSDPFLKDPNFIRSVVLVCEHNEEGSFGFVLSKQTTFTLGELVEQAAGINIPVYEGGPVEKNTLHFIHQQPDIAGESVEVKKGIYWGGNFEQVLAALRTGYLKPKDIRFFMGYSGWSAKQLEEEYEEKSWILADASPAHIFSVKDGELWKQSLQNLGGEYARMIHYPTDPQLN